MEFKMAVCKKCGASVESSGAFCPNCGASMKSPESTESASQEFTFAKVKMMGNLTYKRTTSEISITGGLATMVQTVKRIFRKEQKNGYSFAISSVTSAKVHTVLDFWDTLYAIILFVLGLFQPACFLIAAICFWCGYGKEIELLLTDGGKIKIPLAGSKADLEAFLQICGQ